MIAPHASETLAAIVAASEALARAFASNPRPLVPATQACPACGAVRQVASPGPSACRGCSAAAPKTRAAA
jgi:hypothetical protein